MRPGCIKHNRTGKVRRCHGSVTVLSRCVSKIRTFTLRFYPGPSVRIGLLAFGLVRRLPKVKRLLFLILDKNRFFFFFCFFFFLFFC